MKQLDEDEVLTRYRAAFRRANGEDAPYIVRTPYGWYKMQGYGPKRRLKEFVEWAERLEKRPAAETEA